MAEPFNFTKKALDALPLPPVGKRTFYDDSHTRGLRLVVHPGSTKTFILYRKIDGRPERITLGHYPDTTIEQARGKASGHIGEIAKGNNPQEAKRKVRAEMTVGELFTRYLTHHAKLHKKTWMEDQSQFERYLSGWATRRLSAVRKTDIQALHAKVGHENGRYAANRLLSLLHVLFNKAIEWGWDKANPAHGIKRFREKSRERFLESDELPRFFAALAEEPNATIRDYVLISLLTGARRANVQAMRWEEVNMQRTTWTIPDTKNGSPHTVPLTQEAMAILTERQRTLESEFVFPGLGVSGHLIEPRKAWLRLLKRAGLDNLRLHDLRRTLGSWQAATGANLSVIGKTLAHKNVSTTAIYARLSLDPVRQAVETATTAMLAAGGLLPKAEVVKLEGKK